MAEVEITREFIFKAMQQQGVKAHLGVVAERIRKRAEQIAADEDIDMETWVKQDTRPGGRPQAVVYGDNSEQEYGTVKVGRRRILGRAADEAR